MDKWKKRIIRIIIAIIVLIICLFFIPAMRYFKKASEWEKQKQRQGAQNVTECVEIMAFRTDAARGDASAI